LRVLGAVAYRARLLQKDQLIGDIQGNAVVVAWTGDLRAEASREHSGNRVR
jgi:hypothetical protein